MSTKRPDELLARIREALTQLRLRETAAQLEHELHATSQPDGYIGYGASSSHRSSLGASVPATTGYVMRGYQRR